MIFDFVYLNISNHEEKLRGEKRESNTWGGLEKIRGGISGVAGNRLPFGGWMSIGFDGVGLGGSSERAA